MARDRCGADTVLGVILFNAALLVLETSNSAMVALGPVLTGLDHACLAFFCIGLVTKFYANGRRFFRDPWNWFDAIVIGIALAPATGSLSVLRALRILRLLRVVSVAPRLRRVVEGFIRALPGMTSVFLLTGLIFHVGSVLATRLFGASHPEWFDTIGRSAYSLFQVMTLESWSMGIVRPVMEVEPLAWLFFLPFIIVTAFAVVNLLVGLVVNSMQEAHHEEEKARATDYHDAVLQRLAAIEAKLDGRSDPGASARRPRKPAPAAVPAPHSPPGGTGGSASRGSRLRSRESPGTRSGYIRVRAADRPGRHLACGHALVWSLGHRIP